MPGALLNVVARIAVALCVGAALLFLFTILSLVGGSQTGNVLSGTWMLASLVFTGWSLLPLARHSKLGFYASAALWISLGVYLGIPSRVGISQGSSIAVWLFASLILVGLLAVNPPSYVQLDKPKDQDSREDGEA